MSFIKRLFNRRSRQSIDDLNQKFLDAIPREWDHSEASETQLTQTLLGFLDMGADIDAKDRLGWTALARLAIWGYTKPALALLERQAHVDPKDRGDATAFHGAAQNNNAELLKRLLEKSAESGRLPLGAGLMGVAVGGRVNGQEDREKKLACVEMLAARGLTIGRNEKPCAYDFPYLAPYCPGLAEAREIAAASAAGDTAKIRELAEKGFRPDLPADFGRDTPLFNAALKGDIPMMKELINLDSDLNIMCARSDKTPLMAAAESGRQEALELLIDSGADIVAHVRYERDSYDEPGHSRPDLYSSAWKGGPEMQQRVKELFAPSITLMRRAKIMKPLKPGPAHRRP